MAALDALPEAGGYAVGAPRRNLELLPNESTFGRRGSHQWQYQVAVTPWPRLQKLALSPAEDAAHGGDPHRIHGPQESSLKMRPSSNSCAEPYKQDSSREFGSPSRLKIPGSG